MRFSIPSRRRKKALKGSSGPNATQCLSPRLRLLRIENLESRRLLSAFSGVASQLETQISTYQAPLDSALTGAGSLLNSLPVVGTQISSEISSAQSAIDGVAMQIQNRIHAFDNANLGSDFVAALYNVLGPANGGANILASANASALNNQSLMTDIHVTMPITVNGTDVNGEVEMRLHVPLATSNANLQTGLESLPIQFQANGNVAVTSFFDIELAVQISGGNVTLPQASLSHYSSGLGGPGGAQMAFSVIASVSGSLTAYAGFLQGSVSTTNTTVPAVGTQNQLIASFYANSFASPQLSLGGSANLDLNGTLKITGAPDYMPSISTDLAMQWPDLGNPASASFTFGSPQLQLGNFFQQEIQPVLNHIIQYTAPVLSAVKALEQPIPGLSSLPGPFAGLSMLTILQTLWPDAYNDIKPVVSFANELTSLISEVSFSNGSISFPSFTLGGPSGAPLTGPQSTLPQVTTDLSNVVAVGNAIAGGGLSGLSAADLDGASSSMLSDIEGNSDWLGQNISSGGSGLASTLKSGMQPGGGGINFPILDDPKSLLGLLFGKDVDLVTLNTGEVTTPSLNIDLPTITIPVVGPISIDILISASFQAGFDLDLGYDTSGLRKFLQDGGNISKIGDLVNGFYVQGPHGSDPGTNFFITGGINVAGGPGVSVGFASGIARCPGRHQRDVYTGHESGAGRSTRPDFVSTTLGQSRQRLRSHRQHFRLSFGLSGPQFPRLHGQRYDLQSGQGAALGFQPVRGRLRPRRRHRFSTATTPPRGRSPAATRSPSTA